MHNSEDKLKQRKELPSGVFLSLKREKIKLLLQDRILFFLVVSYLRLDQQADDQVEG